VIPISSLFAEGRKRFLNYFSYLISLCGPFCAFSGHGIKTGATDPAGWVGAEKDHGWRDFVRLHPCYAHHRARRTRGDRLLFGWIFDCLFACRVN
jgi:hypothetical protein